MSIKSPLAKSFQDLLVWKLSHQLVLKTYSITKIFPKDELFGLTSQLRRASVSVPANIAEGFRRRSGTEKARFLNIAQSSLEECRYYFILTNDLEFGNCDVLLSDLEEISRMLDRYYSLVCNTAKVQKGGTP